MSYFRTTTHTVDTLFERAIPEPNSGCWLWTGAANRLGYGHLSVNGKMWNAAPLMWSIVNGAISDKMFVCHKCDTPPCINPDHLFLGSHDDNMADQVSKGRSPKGERNPQAKLTEADVRFIRSSYYSNNALGKALGVSSKTVWSVRNYKRWAGI